MLRAEEPSPTWVNQPQNPPAVEDHGRAVTSTAPAAAWYRRAQRAQDWPGTTSALSSAVDADPSFAVAAADLDAVTGTANRGAGRHEMPWERHHVEVVRTAAGGDGRRAADLLREHLATVGCDPIALRITARLLCAAGAGDEINDLTAQLPRCHGGEWPYSS
ncbi:MAG: hypothetical protein ACRDZ8_08165 [Acidimicrobiales bacterium]